MNGVLDGVQGSGPHLIAPVNHPGYRADPDPGIRRHVRELAFPVPAARTLIRYAELGSDAGFIGAAACARKLCRSERP